MKRNKNIFILLFVIGIVAVCCSPVFAGDAMPWNSKLEIVQKSLTGTTATIVSILAVLGAGLGLALGEGGGGAKKLLMVVMGIGIALGATSIISSFGGGGGCEFPVSVEQGITKDQK